MALSEQEVAKLGYLARIELGPEELTRLSGQLDQILDAISRVAEVATDDVPATSHPQPLTNVFRPDVVRPSLDPEVALAQAPQAEESRFRVPRILDEEA